VKSYLNSFAVDDGLYMNLEKVEIIVCDGNYTFVTTQPMSGGGVLEYTGCNFLFAGVNLNSKFLW
jgi:hypothetical protein